MTLNRRSSTASLDSPSPQPYDPPSGSGFRFPAPVHHPPVYHPPLPPPPPPPPPPALRIHISGTGIVYSNDDPSPAADRSPWIEAEPASPTPPVVPPRRRPSIRCDDKENYVNSVSGHFNSPNFSFVASK